MANITGIVDMSNFEGMWLRIPNIGCFKKVLASDLESDNSISNASIARRIPGGAACSARPTSQASLI